MKKFGNHLRGHFVAYLALFFALGGTSIAAVNALPNNSVGSAQIKNGAIQKVDLAKRTVSSLRGLRGTRGLQGPAGPRGPAGPAGATGPPGPSNPNADTLNGYPANGLTRIAQGTGIGFEDHEIGTADDSVGSVTIQAPGKGFVRLSAAATFFGDRDGCPCSVVAELKDDSNGALSPYLVGEIQATGEDAGLSPTWVFPVSGAGSRTYELLVRSGAAASIGVFNTTISAEFSPFGGNGLNTSSTTAAGAGSRASINP